MVVFEVLRVYSMIVLVVGEAGLVRQRRGYWVKKKTLLIAVNNQLEVRFAHDGYVQGV